MTMLKIGEDNEIDVSSRFDFCKFIFAFVQIQLAKGRQVLLDKLSVILDPKTANDFVYPKTNEIRQHLSLEELLLRT
jgi:hypothetical protein